jgi:hypothetical protein
MRKKEVKLILVPTVIQAEKKIGDMVLFYGNDHRDHLVIVGEETDSLYWEIRSGKAVQPYLIGGEEPKKGDLYVDLRESYFGVYKAESVTENYILEKEINRPLNWCKKVIATPSQIGLIRYDGGKALGKLSVGDIMGIVSNGGKCSIEMDRNLIPERKSEEEIYSGVIEQIREELERPRLTDEKVVISI